MTYIETDLDCFDLWIKYGLLELRDYLSKWTEFVRLYGE